MSARAHRRALLFAYGLTLGTLAVVVRQRWALWGVGWTLCFMVGGLLVGFLLGIAVTVWGPR